MDSSPSRHDRIAHPVASVLDNLAEGLFIVDTTGQIAPEYSARLAEWLGEPRLGDTFIAYLGRRSPHDECSALVNRQQMVDDILPAELALRGPGTVSRPSPFKK